MKKQGILDRIKFFKQRTDLFKNIDSINASYSLKIDLINAERNRKLAKEKRRFNYRIKKISLQE